jgi:hypothetical protein
MSAAGKLMVTWGSDRSAALTNALIRPAGQRSHVLPHETERVGLNVREAYAVRPSVSRASEGTFAPDGPARTHERRRQARPTLGPDELVPGGRLVVEWRHDKPEIKREVLRLERKGW